MGIRNPKRSAGLLMSISIICISIACSKKNNGKNEVDDMVKEEFDIPNGVDPKKYIESKHFDMETDGLLAVELSLEQMNWVPNAPNRITIKYTNQGKQPISRRVNLALNIDGPQKRDDKHHLTCQLPINSEVSDSEFFPLDLEGKETSEYSVDLSSVLCKDFFSKKRTRESLRHLKDILVPGRYEVYLETYRHGHRPLRTKTLEIVVVEANE